MAARNSRHAIAFVAVALLFVIGTGTALLLDRMRQTAREAADGVVQRAASVVESTVNRLFLQIDGTLASLPALVGPLSRNREADADAVSRVLRSINFQNLNFRDLLLVRPDGVAWASAQARRATGPCPSTWRISARRYGRAPSASPARCRTRRRGNGRCSSCARCGCRISASSMPRRGAHPLSVTLLNPAAEVPGLRSP